MSGDVPMVAYLRGDDGWSLDQAVARITQRLEAATGMAPDRWRVTGAEADPALITERVATTPMFGGGTVAVVVDPGPLVGSKANREALEQTIRNVAPGNVLVFIEQGDAGSKRSAYLQRLETAVKAAGGYATELKAPREGQLAAWLEGRASERGMSLAPGAAKELARRVGGFVREGDVDRQRQGSLAMGELAKLALYRPLGPVTEDDVRALVPEVVPDSTWAFLDAVGERRTTVAGPLLDRLLDTTPAPVVLAQLHRRVRELAIAADLLAEHASPAEMVKAIGGHPYRVQTIAKHARHWSVAELEDSLEGILELDAMVKGAPDAGRTDRQLRLSFALWIREHVARETVPARPGSAPG